MPTRAGHVHADLNEHNSVPPKALSLFIPVLCLPKPLVFSSHQEAALPASSLPQKRAGPYLAGGGHPGARPKGDTEKSLPAGSTEDSHASLASVFFHRCLTPFWTPSAHYHCHHCDLAASIAFLTRTYSHTQESFRPQPRFLLT